MAAKQHSFQLGEQLIHIRKLMSVVVSSPQLTPVRFCQPEFHSSSGYIGSRFRYPTLLVLVFLYSRLKLRAIA
jgi:hypothetical protein